MTNSSFFQFSKTRQITLIFDLQYKNAYSMAASI
jgi:hypothetical protein